MKTLLLLTLLLLAMSLPGQDATPTEATVEVKRGEVQRGTLIGYRYGSSVVLVKAGGEVVEIPWRNVRRVTYSSTNSSTSLPVEKTSFTVPTDAPPLTHPLPDRRWRHAVTTWIGGSASGSQQDIFNGNSFVSGDRPVSTGVGYQMVRQYDKLAVGLGPGYEIMSAARKERLASLTGLVEYRMGKRRLQPVLRFRLGGSVPIGHSEVRLEQRRVSPVYHPSVGVQLAPAAGHWSALTLDLGYRITRLESTTINQNLEVIERRAQYRRLTFSLGTNF